MNNTYVHLKYLMTKKKYKQYCLFIKQIKMQSVLWKQTKTCASLFFKALWYKWPSLVRSLDHLCNDATTFSENQKPWKFPEVLNLIILNMWDNCKNTSDKHATLQSTSHPTENFSHDLQRIAKIDLSLKSKSLHWIFLIKTCLQIKI